MWGVILYKKINGLRRTLKRWFRVLLNTHPNNFQKTLRQLLRYYVVIFLPVESREEFYAQIMNFANDFHEEACLLYNHLLEVFLLEVKLRLSKAWIIRVVWYKVNFIIFFLLWVKGGILLNPGVITKFYLLFFIIINCTWIVEIYLLSLVHIYLFSIMVYWTIHELKSLKHKNTHVYRRAQWFYVFTLIFIAIFLWILRLYLITRYLFFIINAKIIFF